MDSPRDHFGDPVNEAIRKTDHRLPFMAVPLVLSRGILPLDFGGGPLDLRDRAVDPQEYSLVGLLCSLDREPVIEINRFLKKEGGLKGLKV